MAKTEKLKLMDIKETVTLRLKKETKRRIEQGCSQCQAEAQHERVRREGC